MKVRKTIPVVDLFAGPGGLGEGFSSAKGDPFKIIVSAEMEASAHSTLRLRAYYRILRRQGKEALRPYYRFCNGESLLAYDDSSKAAWDEAGREALQLTLGGADDNQRLDKAINSYQLDDRQPWVLIGGPPCQAYSLAGRSRNRGKKDYVPEEDGRHFLYREYLRIIQKYRPAVFVMENVRGILSSTVSGKRIFHTILQDLADPDSATNNAKSHQGYRIHSLVKRTSFKKGDHPEEFDVRDFVIRAEEFGIPQARHRVILLGIRSDLDVMPELLEQLGQCTVADAISSLPVLRSRITKQPDSDTLWASLIQGHFHALAQKARFVSGMEGIAETLMEYSRQEDYPSSFGGLRVENSSPLNTKQTPELLAKWYQDENLKFWLNSETRGHMQSDLLRYAYAACFAKANNRSPKGHEEFNLPGLHPNHKNWKSGKFSDRFRVQIVDSPATTITSHISKDGHYFIHPDPRQCRSLTVREAARLQTFPDNYFFMGNRTQQFHQVGNAVPPLLAKKIAEIVASII